MASLSEESEKRQTVLSKEPEASLRPSQFQATECTLERCGLYSRVRGVRLNLARRDDSEGGGEAAPEGAAADDEEVTAMADRVGVDQDRGGVGDREEVVADASAEAALVVFPAGTSVDNI